MESEELALLDQLLAVATTEREEEAKQPSSCLQLHEDESFLSEIAANDLKALENQSGSKKKGIVTSKSVKKLSLIHSGDTDSSDDESNRDYQNSKYNECGKDIKHLLPETKSSEFVQAVQKTWKPNKDIPLAKKTCEKPSSSFFGPQVQNKIPDFFGIRITNPLISSTALQDRMINRTSVTMSQMKLFVKTVAPDQDWVVAGCLVQKSTIRTSQNGHQYIIWTLSDLQNDLKSVSMFLFRSAYKELWKTTVGQVVGVLNPSVMDNKEGSRHEATLSIDNHQRVMLLGQSKDFGYCKSKKKDGEKCTAFVNTNRCTYCIFHVKQEYQKCSIRSELQSQFAGGGLNRLRNKVLGKNEVFYQGKSYSAIPAKKSKKLMERDNKLLSSLTNKDGIKTSPALRINKPKKGLASSLEISRAQRVKDIQMLKKLNGSGDLLSGLETKNTFCSEELSSGVTLEDSRKTALDVIASLKARNQTPKLSNFNKIELSKNDHLNDLKTKYTFNLKEDTEKMKIKNTSNIKENTVPKLSDPNKIELSLSDLKTKNKPNVLTDSIKTSSDLKPKNLAPKLSDPNKIELNINSKDHLSDLKTKQTSNIKEDSKKTTSDDIVNQTLKLSDPVQLKNKNPLEIMEDSENPTLDGIVNHTPKITDPNNTELRIKSKDHLSDLKTKNTSNIDGDLKITDKSIDPSLVFGVKDIDTSKLKLFKNLSSGPAPKLSTPKNSLIDLNSPIQNRSKIKALQWVQRHGPIDKKNPMGTKQSGVKRFLEESDEFVVAKKTKIDAEKAQFSDRFKKIMALTSAHADLLEQRDLDEEDKYFNKLEVRERMEEKMMTTYKIQCKAVRCLNCKYINFSAAQKCKDQKHKFKVFDAIKRFFKCGNCGNRTVSLDICPLLSCKNCGSSKWERTTMMKEKIAKIGNGLSIRGGEQTFVNSVVTDANINLLVPES